MIFKYLMIHCFGKLEPFVWLRWSNLEKILNYKQIFFQYITHPEPWPGVGMFSLHDNI